MAETNIRKNRQGYGYKYTDLAQIHEYLEQNNMSYYQYTETDAVGNDYIYTVPIIDGKEMSPRRGSRIIQAVLSGKSNPAQEQGSALTYARRYSLLMAFGLATEDDDAASLTQKKSATPSNGSGTDIEALKQILSKNGVKPETVFGLYKINGWDEITDAKYTNIVKNIENIKKKQEEK